MALQCVLGASRGLGGALRLLFRARRGRFWMILEVLGAVQRETEENAGIAIPSMRKRVFSRCVLAPPPPQRSKKHTNSSTEKPIILD